MRLSSYGKFGVIGLIVVVAFLFSYVSFYNGPDYSSVVSGEYIESLSFDGEKAHVFISEKIDEVNNSGNLFLVFVVNGSPKVKGVMPGVRSVEIDLNSLGISDPESIERVEAYIGGEVLVESIELTDEISPFIDRRDNKKPSTKDDVAETTGKTRRRSSGGGGGGSNRNSGNDVVNEVEMPEVCVPRTCEQQGYECGTKTDGCEAEIYCGECSDGLKCYSGYCASEDESFSFVYMSDDNRNRGHIGIRHAYDIFDDIELVLAMPDLGGQPNFYNRYKNAWNDNPYLEEGDDKFPIFFGVGNHDVEVPSTMDFLSKSIGPNLTKNLPGMRNFKEGPYPTYEGQENYQDRNTTYSFDYKNAHFIFVNWYGYDSYWNYDEILNNGRGNPSRNNNRFNTTYYPVSCISEEYLQFVNESLAETDADHKFLVYHEPAQGVPGGRHTGDSLGYLYCPGNYVPTSWVNKSRPMRDRFWQMLNDYNVTATFVGHSHHHTVTFSRDYWNNGRGVYEVEPGHPANTAIVNIRGDNAILNMDRYDAVRGTFYSNFDDLEIGNVEENIAPKLYQHNAKYESGFFVTDKVDYSLEVDQILEGLGSLYFEAKDANREDELTFSVRNLPDFFEVIEYPKIRRIALTTPENLAEEDIGQYQFEVVVSDGEYSDSIVIDFEVLPIDIPRFLGTFLPNGSTINFPMHRAYINFFCGDNGAGPTVGRYGVYDVWLNGEEIGCCSAWHSYSGKTYSDKLSGSTFLFPDDYDGVEDVAEGEYVIESYCQDKAGHKSEKFNFTVYITNDPDVETPQVIGAFPYNGAEVSDMDRVSFWVVNDLYQKSIPALYNLIEVKRDGQVLSNYEILSGRKNGTLAYGSIDILFDDVQDSGHFEINFSDEFFHVYVGGTTPEGSCSDGIQNRDETGIDCGGICIGGLEDSCIDGIDNDNDCVIDENAVDCSSEGESFWQSIDPASGGWVTAFDISPVNGNRVMVGGDVLGASFSENGGFDWKPSFGFRMSEIESFEFHPTDENIVFAATLGGIYKSIDGGENWELKRGGELPAALSTRGFTSPISSISFDRNNPNVLYAATGSLREPGKVNSVAGKIYRSVDLGETWNLINGFYGGEACNRNIQNIEVDPFDSSIIYVVLECGGVYKSVDSGVSFESKSEGLVTPLSNLILDSSNGGVLFVSSKNNGVYKSVDGAETWQRVLQSTTPVIDICEADTDILYAADRDWKKGVWKSVDGGENWVLMFNRTWSYPEILESENYPLYPYSQGSTGFNYQALSVDPSNCDHVIVGGDVNMILTTDGGETWQSAGGKTDSEGNFWQGTGFGGLCGNWVEYDVNLPSRYLMGAWDSGLWQTWNNGESWSRKVRGMAPAGETEDEVWGHFLSGSISKQDGSKIYVIKTEGATTHLWKSENTANDWFKVSGNGAKDVKVSIDNDEIVFIVRNGMVEKSIDGGNSFTSKTSDIDALRFTMHPQDSNLIYVTSNAGIYKSVDAGETWDLMPGSPGHPSWFEFKIYAKVVIDPRNDSRLFMNRYNGFYRSEDAGETWERVKYFSEADVNPEGTMFTGAMTVDKDGVVYGVTNIGPNRDLDPMNSGIWRSVDNGTTWEQDNEGLRVLRHYSIDASPVSDVVIAGGACGGFVQRKNISCEETWSCGDWGSCLSGVQSRICVANSECGTEYNMPEEIRVCSVQEFSGNSITGSVVSEEGVSLWGLIKNLFNFLR